MSPIPMDRVHLSALYEALDELLEADEGEVIESANASRILAARVKARKAMKAALEWAQSDLYKNHGVVA